jgi:phospholipase/lecithinase/hemolysin
LQLQAAASIHGRYTADDVLLIVGGGNDAADLAGAWLGATTLQGQQAFANLLDSVLGAGSAAALLGNGSNPNAAVVAGMSYMETLAGNLAAAIQEHAVGKGAAKVVVMNMPDITLTPRFSAVLAGVSLQAGPTQAAAVRQAIEMWVNAFNNSLANRFANSTTVAVLDFNTTFRAQVASPGTYGFSNGTETACPATGTDSSGLPTYTFPTCSATNLSATAGKPSSTWWETYLFSDGFHPTPRAHTRAAELALALIQQRGWN